MKISNGVKKSKTYNLPKLPYGYKDLEPYISEEQLKIHHQKHHIAYITGANGIFEKLEAARKDKSEPASPAGGLDMKSILKSLSFNIGGHILHSLFWGNLAPAKSGGGKPNNKLLSAIKEEFGSFERFKSEFGQAALSVEGSGWAALVFDKESGRLLIAQIEKHNANVLTNLPILMVLDVFEHAYYLDYKNDRAKFIEAFWNIVNWKEVEKRWRMNLK